MQKIIPHLWFDNQAEEAANLYVSTFPNSQVINFSHYGEAGAEVSGMSEGSVMTVEFELEGQSFIALNGGPVFKFTPAISFFVNCSTAEEMDMIWSKLSEGGFELMELNEYPFSKRFGWLQDRFGVNWQINLGSHKQKITPYMLFVGEQCGRAKEAISFYSSIFNSKSEEAIKHETLGEYFENEGENPVFALNGQQFMALDSDLQHNFTFSEAISYFVSCENQAEVDRLWRRLTEDGEEVQCGWLKDKFGVSWQIVPAGLSEILNDPDDARRERVMEAMFKMKKIDINKLKKVYQSVLQ